MDNQKKDRRLLIQQQQLALLYSAIPNSLLANLFGCLVGIMIFTPRVEQYRLYIWVGLMLSVNCLRYFNYWQYRKAKDVLADLDLWYVKFRIGALVLAFALGSSGFLLFVYHNSSYQMLLALLIVIIGSFATTTLSPHRPIVVAFLLIVFFPIVTTLFFLATEVSQYFSWLLILLTVMLIISALGSNNTMSKSIRLSIEAQLREEVLRTSQQRLAMYINATPLAVIEWDIEMQVRDWNPAAQRIFGYRREEIIGMSADDILITSKDIQEQEKRWDQLLENTGGFEVLQENCRKDGTVILCEWLNTPLVDDNNLVVGVISLVQDVTERIANERLKNEFVSIVSHELRTPLTSIKGSLALLDSGVMQGNAEESAELLHVALENTNRLQLLINDILDVEKLESGKMEYRISAEPLDDLVEQVIRANSGYADQFAVTLQCSVTSPCQVNMDPDRIFQVLNNLVSNAIKFSVSGGDVHISVIPAGDRFRVEVQNRGEIIPPGDRTKLFGKFFQRDSSTTRSRGGSGLGLYICQKILREHQAELDFESSEQAGTIFFFSLIAAATNNVSSPATGISAGA